jgi:flagellar hook-associated protein FlgK
MLKSLNVAQTGLSAAKIAVENVSNNIANENTPGYKKRVVQLSELTLGDSRFTGSGVRADNAYRITSEYMFNNIMKENTKNSYYDEISSIVGNVEQMFKETDTSGFSNDLNRFFQAVENLRTTPSSELYKTTLKTTGSNLVDSLQNLYENIEQQESITYNRLEDNVQEINAILNDIGELNQQMGLSNNSTNDLLDKRDQLEKELSALVDIDVDRTDGDYQLKIGGAIAVRYNTNIREVNLVEDNTTQIDRFATEDANGTAIDSIANGRTFEIQELVLTGASNNNMILDSGITFTPNGESAIALDYDETEGKVLIDGGINGTEPFKITQEGVLTFEVTAQSNGDSFDFKTGDTITITTDTDSDLTTFISGSANWTDNGDGTYTANSDNTVNFPDAGDSINVQRTVGTGLSDVDTTITYKFDNTHEVSVTFGDYVLDANGNQVDLDNDGVADQIDESNFIRALKYEINHNTYISEKVTAFNGNYQVDEDGNKTDLFSSDKFLVVEANQDGTDGSFVGRISITTAADGNDTIFKDDYQSVDAENKVYLAVYDSEVNVNSGIIKAQLENLTTTSPNNKIIDYKDKLDSLASALSDIYSKYVVEDNGSYTYGNISTDSYNGTKTVENLGLFSGSTVKTLVFNEEMVNDLDQEDLDYISSMQWKDDIDFDGFAQDGSTQEKSSFSEFFQEVRVNISSDKENNDFLKETQTAVVQSLEASYEQLTKVDSDEEMINLIQFQAAYTANAKIITVVDEMLQTLLGIRR